jgi:hypothetical protein
MKIYRKAIGTVFLILTPLLFSCGKKDEEVKTETVYRDSCEYSQVKKVNYTPTFRKYYCQRVFGMPVRLCENYEEFCVTYLNVQETLCYRKY